ncbi:MAG TPA: hypothetical protein PK156_08965 [Polyangium sp.]|nr:hypothetical protein [Polyangium sp.]
MSISRKYVGLLVVAISTAIGCAPTGDEFVPGDQLDVPLDPAASGTFYEPPTGRNGLIPEQFWSTVAQSSMRELQNDPLESGLTVTMTNGEIVPVMKTPPNTAALLHTYPDVVKHLVQCTLTAGRPLFDPVNEVVYRGHWGLANSWATSPISGNPALQEWVTACMIARLNNLGVHVNILLEGSKPAIEVNSTWNPVFWYNESTVRGNMFASTRPISPNSPAFDAYLCREQNLVNTCPGDGGADWVDRRLCDNAPSTCGLIDMGKCTRSLAAGGRCIPNATNPEHWDCRETILGSFYTTTIGVQLEVPLDPGECTRQ